MSQRTSSSSSNVENDFDLLPESVIGVENRFCLVYATTANALDDRLLPVTLAFIDAATVGSSRLDAAVLSIIDKDCPVEDLPTSVRKWWTGTVRRGEIVCLSVCLIFTFF